VQQLHVLVQPHILEWLDEIGVNRRKKSVYTPAAESGSIEMVHWFTERGAVYNAKVLLQKMVILTSANTFASTGVAGMVM
jgi:hypothetical protein